MNTKIPEGMTTYWLIGLTAGGTPSDSSLLDKSTKAIVESELH